MNVLTTRELKERLNELQGQTVMLQGWIRNHRKQKNMGFIDFFDGTCFKNPQVVYDNTIEDYAAIQTLPGGYDTVCTDGMFSQGEWQLLSIARAAAADPAVLLLDEITANLDAETEARVLEALRRASEGRTVLSVSHRIYENLGGRTVEVRTQNA